MTNSPHSIEWNNDERMLLIGVRSFWSQCNAEKFEAELVAIVRKIAGTPFDVIADHSERPP